MTVANDSQNGETKPMVVGRRNNFEIEQDDWSPLKDLNGGKS
jgi:hypothetical protein